MLLRQLQLHQVIISAPNETNQTNKPCLTLTKIHPTQLNALVVQQQEEEEEAEEAAETNDLQSTDKVRPSLPLSNPSLTPTLHNYKTLLNFYYLSTTLCTDTENETKRKRMRIRLRNGTENEAKKLKS